MNFKYILFLTTASLLPTAFACLPVKDIELNAFVSKSYYDLRVARINLEFLKGLLPKLYRSG